MKKICCSFVVFCLVFVGVNSLSAQCEIFSSEENPQGEYSVQVSVVPTVVVPSDINCPFGYNWNVRLDYNIRFLGDTPPSELFTLQGNLYCDGQATFFDLPNEASSGDTITVGNIFRNETDCQTIVFDSLGCDSIVLEIQGPGIPFTTINCPIGASTCPDQVNVTANDFCLFVSYDSIVPPLADSVIFDGDVFFFRDGEGTTDNPAIYQSGGGNGACNANEGPLAGELVVGGDTCTYMAGILPVTFMTLSAEEVGADLVLSWTVAHEDAVSYYMVQTYIDNQWISLADVVPSIDFVADIKQYRYRAIDLPSRDQYLFRIVSMDEDGSMIYSDVTQFRRDRSTELMIAPNPIGSAQRLTVFGINLAEYQVQIINPITAQRWPVIQSGGGLQLPSLPAATYLLQFSHLDHGNRLNATFLKM